jgi:hypothetical protein
MKRSIGILLLFSWCLAVGAASAQTKVVFAWTPPGTSGWATCNLTATPPVNSGCVKDYALVDVTTSSKPVTVGNPVVTATSFTLTPLPTPGSHIYNLYIESFDFSGNALNWPSATVTVNVPNPLPTPTAPTGFTATPQ